MILKGAANFLLLLMQDVSVASVNRILSNDDGDGDGEGEGEGERQRSNRCRLEKHQLCTCSTLFCRFLCSHCTTTM